MSEELTFAPPQPEALVETVNTLDMLRAARREEASRGEKAMLARCVYDDIAVPQSAIIDTLSAPGSVDAGILYYREYLALDALGQDPRYVSSIIGHDKDRNEEVLHIGIGEGEIVATPLAQGLSFRFKEGDKPTDGTEEATVREKYLERLKRSPGHMALHELKERITAQPELLDAHQIATDDFDIDSDKLGTLGVFAQYGFVRNQLDPEYLEESTKIEDVVRRTAEVFSGSERTEGEGGLEAFTITEAHYEKQLVINPDTRTARLIFKTRPDYWYAEIADQMPRGESIPFVETRAARELLEALDGVGLMPHPKFQNEMVRTGEAERFGGVYTQMSREIAKWVDRDERVIPTNLFVRYNPRTHAKGKSARGDHFESMGIHEDIEYQKSDEELRQDQEYVKERLLSVDETAMSEPAKLLFRLAKQALTRDAGSTGLPELPVTKSDVLIEGGACFDVAAYYIGAAGDWSGLRTIEENGVKLLEKTHGKHTFMLQEPAILNGVELPKGTLMQRGEDDGWAMLRLTPFCFDNPEDQLATGSELTKALANEREAVQRIGGVSLINLVQAVR